MLLGLVIPRFDADSDAEVDAEADVTTAEVTGGGAGEVEDVIGVEAVEVVAGAGGSIGATGAAGGDAGAETTTGGSVDLMLRRNQAPRLC